MLLAASGCGFVPISCTLGAGVGIICIACMCLMKSAVSISLRAVLGLGAGLTSYYTAPSYAELGFPGGGLAMLVGMPAI